MQDLGVDCQALSLLDRDTGLFQAGEGVIDILEQEGQVARPAVPAGMSPPLL
ncbi:hypothetical protein HJB67_09470 [Rhizobium lentis]|uniref:Uncharacterized protein n=1 Tax=Rhizobium lentis TaxID=1138194 RepID=A0A9Q3M903_9HYPH|nr:hypothetical protein [Rhizobium lentis]MBX5024038.1 hypothetical protein [Rhizobium lentis]